MARRGAHCQTAALSVKQTGGDGRCGARAVHTKAPHSLPNMAAQQPVARYAEALAFARGLSLHGEGEWAEWCRKSGALPSNVPAAPDKAYALSGWRGWAHWLGAQAAPRKRRGAPKRQPSGGGDRRRAGADVTRAGDSPFPPFEEALRVARSLQLNNREEWAEWCKAATCPADVPPAPDRVYRRRGWRGWAHWLGTCLPNPAAPAGARASGVGFLAFADALRVARSLRLHRSVDMCPAQILGTVRRHVCVGEAVVMVVDRTP